MAVASDKPFRGLVHRFLDAFSELGACEELEDLEQAYRLGSKKVRLPPAPIPLQLLLGENGTPYNLCPELRLDRAGNLVPSEDYLLFDPATFFSSISGFIRLRPGDDVVVGRTDLLQNDLLCFPDSVAEHHLSIKIRESRLTLKRGGAGAPTCVAPLLGDEAATRIAQWRQGKIEHLARVLPGEVAPLPRQAAQDLIDQALELFAAEPHRPLDWRGMPGGLIEIPDRHTPIIVGDLHAHIDNLLGVLTQNSFLEAIERDNACLIIIGDAVHCEDDGLLEEMETSMLMMDVIFRLKLRFPDRVFYLCGNHDSFSEDIGKGGVPQGLLWAEQLERVRGKQYKGAMDRLYGLLPYAAISRELFTCHAGAPTGKISREMLVDIRRYAHLQHELTRNRLRKPGGVIGYGRADVKQFRKCLGLAPDLPLIVGHTPMSMDDTLWLNVGEIPGHHVVFSAGNHWFGVITRVGQRLLPLRYPTEPIGALLNRMDAAA